MMFFAFGDITARSCDPAIVCGYFSRTGLSSSTAGSSIFSSFSTFTTSSTSVSVSTSTSSAFSASSSTTSSSGSVFEGVYYFIRAAASPSREPNPLLPVTILAYNKYFNIFFKLLFLKFSKFTLTFLSKILYHLSYHKYACYLLRYEKQSWNIYLYLV